MSFYPVPELKYNKQAIADYVNALPADSWTNTYGHVGIQIHRFRAQDCPPVYDILKQFNNAIDLFEHVEFFKTPGGVNLPAHIDNGRKVALNIPVIGDFESTGLSLFHVPEDVAANPVNGAQGFSGRAIQIATVSVTCPYLVDTSIPHGTVNGTHQHRIIMSATVHTKHTFSDLLLLHKQGLLLKRG